MNETLRGVTSGVTSVAVASGAYFAAQLTTFASLVVGGVVLIGVYIALPRKKEKAEMLSDLSSTNGREDEEDVLGYIRETKSEIIESAKRLKKVGYTSQVQSLDEIVVLIDAITDHFKKEQKERLKVIDFAKYHLMNLSKILDSFVDLAESHQTKGIRFEIAKLQKILETVKDGYEDFYEKLKLRQMDSLTIEGEAYMAVLRFENSTTSNIRRNS